MCISLRKTVIKATLFSCQIAIFAVISYKRINLHSISLSLTSVLSQYFIVQYIFYTCRTSALNFTACVVHIYFIVLYIVYANCVCVLTLIFDESERSYKEFYLQFIGGADSYLRFKPETKTCHHINTTSCLHKLQNEKL